MADAAREIVAREIEVAPARMSAFSDTEEAFFAEGVALCEEHRKAHAELAAVAVERASWWRRMWTRTPALA